MLSEYANEGAGPIVDHRLARTERLRCTGQVVVLTREAADVRTLLHNATPRNVVGLGPPAATTAAPKQDMPA